MKIKKMPGFTAEVSLGETSKHYTLNAAPVEYGREERHSPSAQKAARQ
jgi:hypothetical protein